MSHIIPFNVVTDTDLTEHRIQLFQKKKRNKKKSLLHFDPFERNRFVVSIEFNWCTINIFRVDRIKTNC